MQFGMPITTINGGINAVNKVIFCPNNTIVPKLHITPINTTAKLMMVAETDLKKTNNVMADKISDPIKNHNISFLIRSAMMVLINGKPLMCTSVLVDWLKRSNSF